MSDSKEKRLRVSRSTTPSDAELEVILVAENVSSRFGGEAILPLHYFHRLRRRGIQVKLVVHDRVKNELTEDFPETLEDIHFVEDSPLQVFLDRTGRHLPARVRDFTTDWLISVLTAVKQRTVIKALITSGFGDVIHQPTPVSPRLPSLMFGFGRPVVIGPMNGGMSFPPAFRSRQSVQARVFITLARAFANVANTLIPGKRHAAVLLCANDRTANSLPRVATSRRAFVVENGVDLDLWSSPRRTGTHPQRSDIPAFVFIGRLVDWKAVDIFLEAAAQAATRASFKLWIIGSGPELANLRQLAGQLGISNRVEFLGFLPQTECAHYLGAARALVLPSLYECGGAVVLESMCASRPVIATDWGGPGDYLNVECGFLIPPHSRQQLVDAFSDSICVLSQDAELADRMGAAGYQRVRALYDWERKIDAVVGHYCDVIRSSALR